MNIDYLHIGYIDWIKGSEFGMVYDLVSHTKYFFHLNKNPLILDLKKNYYVVFETYYDKRKKQECAKDIVRVAFIEDVELLSTLINKFDKPKSEPNRIGLERLYSGYKSSDIKKVVRLLGNQIKKIEFCSEENLSKLKDNPELVEEYLKSENFKLLTPDKIVEYFHDYIQKNILDLVKKKSSLLTNFNDENGYKLFDKIIYEVEKIDSEESFNYALELIKHSTIIGVKTSEKLILHFTKISSSLYKVKFWLKGKYKNDISSSLKEIFLNIDENLLYDIRNKLIKEDNEQLFESILNEKLHEIDSITNADYESKWKERLSYLDENKQQELHDIIFTKSDDVTKLNMWVSGVTEIFDFDSFKVACITLIKDEQEAFIKKVFKYAEEGKIELTVLMLKELQLFDREMSDKLGIDYSLDIILSTIFELDKGNNFNKKNNIVDVLAHHIEKNPFRELNIDGYFELCEGRSYVSISKDENEKEHISVTRSANIPNGVKFCEGRKSNEVDRIHKLPFWWCRNLICFEPCQYEYTTEDWNKYNLADLLRILNISYQKEDYYTFLGWVNRINSLLSKLNCRGCGKILKPSNQTNYSFYRVNRFICDNKECNHNETIYLNHCMNGKCDYLIDSRDSVKCSNGMYICSNPKCGDCCSTEVFGRRIEYLTMNGQPIPNRLKYLVENNLGHKENKETYCHKCGVIMYGGWEKYEEVKNWMISNKNNSSLIIKSGNRPKDGRWWFLTNFPEEKYVSLKKLGFQVGEKKEEDSYRFISEPFGKMEDPPKYCTNKDCDNYVEQST